MNNFNDLIYIKSKALTTDVCMEIVDRFEKDDRKSEGITSNGTVDFTLKKTWDLHISLLKDWEDIDKILFKSAAENLDAYSEKINNLFNATSILNGDMRDSGYNVKRYHTGDYFHWHTDSQSKDDWVRTVAYVWYLNNVKKDGYTEFATGKKVYPKTGQLLMFPACWTFPHRGVTPKDSTKYIITSFLEMYRNV